MHDTGVPPYTPLILIIICLSLVYLFNIFILLLLLLSRVFFFFSSSPHLSLLLVYFSPSLSIYLSLIYLSLIYLSFSCTSFQQKFCSFLLSLASLFLSFLNSFLISLFLVSFFLSYLFFYVSYLFLSFFFCVKCLFHPLCVCRGGFLAGVVGIGGGLVLGPFLLTEGVPPIVTTSVNTTLILFTSSSASAISIAAAAAPWDYSLFLFSVCFAATLIGKCLIDRLVKKYHADYMLVVFLLFIMIGSIVATTGRYTTEKIKR
ncbi:sulfite exporter protein [Cystoisospora suis]|uniref:Sulfite exporter protein n=1 Tax=Cystoisospora suis TaxID=483139 RepID=A0A2C6KGC6_9APIC|nr:sulfite exporter protein [Cystoisospora suis]